MEFKYGGYTLDDEMVYVDRDGDLVCVWLSKGYLQWRYEKDSNSIGWQDLDYDYIDGFRPVGDVLVKEKSYQIGKYYLMNNGGDSLFKKLAKIEGRYMDDIFVDEDGTRWRGIEVVDPECLGQFE